MSKNDKVLKKTVGRVVGRPEDMRVFEDDDTLVLNKCYLGVEVEMEGVRRGNLHEEIQAWWKIKDDGSLRNNGTEFCFLAPYRGRDIITAIDVLFKHKQDDWDPSIRCGIHVHLDVRNLDFDQLAALATLYTCLESPIFHFAGEARKRNHFCLPWNSATEISTSLYQLAHAVEEDVVKAALGRFHKYSALNFESINRFGTVEFRQLPSTTDAARVLRWCNIVLAMKKYVLYNAQTPSAVFRSISDNPVGLLFSVFGEHANEMMYDGIELDIAQAIDFAHTIVVPMSATSRQYRKED